MGRTQRVRKHYKKKQETKKYKKNKQQDIKPTQYFSDSDLEPNDKG